MDILFLFFMMFLLISISVPIGFAVGGATIITLLLYTDLPLTMVSQYAVDGVDSFPMLAIPFFILAGMIMSSGGIARRIIDVAGNVVGFMVGGLGSVTILASMFFAAISGSALATVSAIGTIMIPEMKKKGYEEGYSATLTAVAGTIGVIIPPSIPLVIFGVVTGTSIGDLFIAGIIPGILIAVVLMITNYFISKKEGYVGQKRLPRKELLQSIWEAKWALITPVIILGGIYAGIFTPTEAAVVAVVYSVIVSVFIYKELSLKDLYRTLVETAVLNGITTFLLGLSTAFAIYLSTEQVPSQILNLLIGITDNKIIILIMINIFLLLIGCIMDNVPATIILAPMLLPVMIAFDISPVQFGIFLTINLTIGLITPPYGCDLFVASAVAGIPIERMLKYLWPFLLAMISILLLATYVPAISMILL